MHTEIETISSTRKKLIITIGEEEKAQARKKAVRKFVAEKELKGYRKGKAPEALVASVYAEEIATDALSNALDNALNSAIKDGNLKVHEHISADDIKAGENGETILTAVVDIVPEFELPVYEGIPVDDKDTPVAEDDIAKYLERLRQMKAKYEPLAEGIPACASDFLTISYEGFTMDGKALAEAVPDAGLLASNPKTWCALENENYRVPGLPQALAGATVGETRTVAVAFPEDYAKETLRGVSAEYKVTVLEGRRMILPELDEAFAKDAKFESLDALKDSVRKRLEINAAQTDADRRRNQIANYLVSNAAFDVPEASFERGVQSVLDNLIEQALHSGQSKEQIEEQREKFLESARKYVLGDMRLAFITRRVAEALELKVSESEYRNAIANYAAENRLDSKQTDEFLKRERKSRWLFSQVLRVKTLDALVAKGTRTNIN